MTFIQDGKIDSEELFKEYEKDNSIFSEESHKIRLIKDAISTLEESDRILLYLYAELQSHRKVAKLLGVTHALVGKRLHQIKLQIQSYLWGLQS